MNTLRGNHLFEFFPASASLASFAFLVMTFAVNWRFFAAVVVMFSSGLLMAAHLLHCYLTFALAWWLVLNGIGLCLALGKKSRIRQPYMLRLPCRRDVTPGPRPLPRPSEPGHDPSGCTFRTILLFLAIGSTNPAFIFGRCCHIRSHRSQLTRNPPLSEAACL